jgi:hypothetical protein
MNERMNALIFRSYHTPEVFKLRPPWGAVDPRGGGGVASCLYEGHICFGRNMGPRHNLYFGRHFASLKYEACFIL